MMADAGSEARAFRIDLAATPDFELGTVRVRPARRQVCTGGGDCRELEPRVMQVLVALASARPEVVSRDSLIETCWDGRIVGDDSINRCIVALRHLARDIDPQPFAIETVSRVGYSLVVPEAPLEGEDEPAGADGEAAPHSSTRRNWPALAALGAFALAATLVFVFLAWSSDRAAGPDVAPASIAVLPFRNLSSGDPFFAEGVGEEILGQLAREPQFRVAGRTSSSMFKDATDLREVGRKLDVAYILEGSVRTQGPRVRVNVALVQASDGIRLWSNSYNGSLDDIFAIQQRIGGAVGGALKRRLVRAPALSGALVTSGDVYNLYLVARGFLRTREPAKIEAAFELLNAATRLDPDYAPVQAALGAAYALSGQAGTLIPGSAEERLGMAKRHIDRALGLAPDLPEALIALAMIDQAGSETRQRLERAVRIVPANAELWHALGNARAATLDFEGALDAFRRTAAIDPFWVRSTTLPAVAWSMGERREALAYEARMMRDHPETLGRRLAALRVAVYRRDWSEAYRLSLEIDRLRPPGVRAVSGPFGADAIYLRVRLDRLGEAALLLRHPMVIDLVRGGSPNMPAVLKAAGGAKGFWTMSPMTDIVSLRLNQHGRGAELVALYDAAFASPEALTARQADGIQNFLDHAPAIVVALRQVGRDAEAERVLALADRAVSRFLGRGRVPYDLLELAARIRALQGRREEALGLLEQAVAMGWQWNRFGMVPRLAEELAYRSIRDDPRFRRIDDGIQAAVARERREAAALGI
jgi:TolB-like protein/DNA-binding winged helix-turn-helix (wHTH) protein